MLSGTRHSLVEDFKHIGYVFNFLQSVLFLYKERGVTTQGEGFHTTKLKLDIRSQVIHDWIEPIMTSVFVNQFAENFGAGTAINSPPLRRSKRLNGCRVKTILEYNVDDVKILSKHVNARLHTNIGILTMKPMRCWVYQRKV